MLFRSPNCSRVFLITEHMPRAGHLGGTLQKQPWEVGNMVTRGEAAEAQGGQGICPRSLDQESAESDSNPSLSDSRGRVFSDP